MGSGGVTLERRAPLITLLRIAQFLVGLWFLAWLFRLVPGVGWLLVVLLAAISIARVVCWRRGLAPRTVENQEGAS